MKGRGGGVVRRRAGARRDLVDVFRRYAREAGLSVARRFLAQAEAAFNRLGKMPGLGTRYEADDPAFGELRFFPLPSRFKNYVVFYRPTPDGVEIARVLHGARDVQAILAEEIKRHDGDDDAEEAADG